MDEKLCPMKFAIPQNSYQDLGMDCEEERCQWWQKERIVGTAIVEAGCDATRLMIIKEAK